MTGYGKSTAIMSESRIDIEIRTLNSKSFDVNFRSPSNFKSGELKWRKLISNKLKRGKVDVLMTFLTGDDQKNIKLNKDLIKSYVADMKDILPLRDGLDNAKLLEIAMKLPDTVNSDSEDISDDDYNKLEEGLQEAINQVISFRQQEGESLLNEFKVNLKRINENLNQIKEIDSHRVDRVRDRLKSSLNDLKIDHDENRFEQELIYYIEKYDISEEKSRLQSHLNYFEETLNLHESNGKKLNFISQEMGREINTIGSKANDAEMQNLVVEMKDQLEKIKEQLLNIL